MNKKTMRFIKNIMRFDAIGNLLDGYSDLASYHQNVILFASLVNDYEGGVWKSWKHEDGRLCFGGGWFIMGIDTPQESPTYHFEGKYWDLFDIRELEAAKHYNDDATKTRAITSSLECGYWIPVIYKNGRWVRITETYDVDYVKCSECGVVRSEAENYCPHCGKKMYQDASSIDEMIMYILRRS